MTVVGRTGGRAGGAPLAGPCQPVYTAGGEGARHPGRYPDLLRPSLDPDSPAHFGQWRTVPTAANRMPAVAGYVRRPGTTVFRAQVLDVLRVRGDRIAQITSFEAHLFAAFGLPLTLR